MEHNIKKTFFISGIVLLLTAYTHAIDWPAAGIAPEQNFALNEQGDPVLGVSFAVSGPVYAADSGEIVFMRDPDERVSGLPSPFGAWLATDIGSGLIAVYARYGEKEPRLSAHIEKQQIIAHAGNSGANEKDGFYFSFFDRKERRWVNPQVIINPLPDTKPPSINAVKLKAPEGRLVNLAQTRVIPQGRYSIFADVNDSIDGGLSQLAPYKISAFVNGTEAGELIFENFFARDGLLMAFRGAIIPVKQVYAEPGSYEAGEFWFSRGIAMLELLAEDRAGNTRTAVFRLTVE